MIRHAFSLCGLVLIMACQPNQNAQHSSPHSIIDQDSLVEIEETTPLPHEGLKKEFPAIGKLTGGCTAFHIGDGLVATAGHCVKDLGENPRELSCHSLDITWGLLAGEADAGRSRCMKILDFQYDQEADYALLQVDPIPATAMKLERDPHAMQSGAEVLVVGYPKGRALSLSGACDARMGSNPDSQVFYHRCDTLPGNSGSPVLDARTLDVLGVHNGDADNSENYGSYLPSPETLIAFQANLHATPPAPTSLQFGPFADQLKKDLVHFTRRQGEFVSFHMKLSVEDGYDKVVLIDGLGRILEFTGVKEQTFQKLTTPVSVVVLTDYSGASESVTIDGITFL